MSIRAAVVRRLVAGAAVAATLVLSSATGAQAVDGAIVNVERSDTGLDVSIDVPADIDVDLAGVSATVDGVDYPAEAFRLSDGDSRVRRTTVLAIDTSESMAGDRFAAAIAAATTFLDAVPADVEVGIVTFSSTVETVLEPTADRDAARSVLADLPLSRGTRLYQAVLASLSLVGDEGQRSVLVLSDGADTGATPIRAVTDALGNSDVTVDVVALEQGAENADTLAQLVSDDGSVIAADSAGLSDAFSEEAAVLARQVGVSITVPADVSGQQVSVGVVLPATGGDVVAQSTIPAAETPAEPTADPLSTSIAVESPPSRSFAVPGWFMYVGIGVFGLGLAVALAMMVPAKPAPMSTEDRVSTYTTGSPAPRPAASPPSRRPRRP